MKALDNAKAIYDLTMNERCEAKVQDLFSNGLHKLMIDLIEELEALENKFKREQANNLSSEIAKTETILGLKKYIEELENRCCNSCKHCKDIFSYANPLCIKDENNPYQIHSREKLKCNYWEQK